MSKLVDGILELIIISFIPFMTWRRKKVGFFDWIGLKKVQTKNISQLLQIILGMP
jgi:CAAX amino terminal protease family protein